MKSLIRVMIADDRAHVCRIIGGLLGRESGLAVCSPCTRLEVIEVLLRRERVDVVLYDIMWDSHSQLDRLAQLTEDFPSVRWCVQSGFPSIRFVKEAFQAAANGFLCKLDAAQECATAVRAVARGERFLSSSLRAKYEIGPDGAVRFIGQRLPKHPPRSREYWVAISWLVIDLGISIRQAEIALAVHDGCSEKEMPERLECAAGTCHAHSRALYGKLRHLGVRGHATLAALTAYSLMQRPSHWEPERLPANAQPV
jgi:DNA-binding NarL/FixJ family response regulator